MNIDQLTVKLEAQLMDQYFTIGDVSATDSQIIIPIEDQDSAEPELMGKWVLGKTYRQAISISRVVISNIQAPKITGSGRDMVVEVINSSDEIIIKTIAGSSIGFKVLGGTTFKIEHTSEVLGYRLIKYILGVEVSSSNLVQ